MGFEFRGFINPQNIISWDPDKMQNGHLGICGVSGAGKSRLIKEILPYLHDRGKNIHVIDVQGTLGVNNVPEEHFKFEARNSPYSINPFEFLMDEINGGPRAQIDDIVEMFRKTFMKNLGRSPNLSAVLRRLIIDTYRKAGIVDDDVSTWGFGLSTKERNDRLPIVSDMKELVDYILDYVRGGYGAKFGSIVASNGKKLNQWQTDISRLIEELRKLETVTSRDEELVEKEKARIISEVNDLRENVNKKQGELVRYFEEYLNFSFLGGDVPAYESLLEENESGYGWLDYKFYADKDRLNTIKTIETYLQALGEAGVFGRSTPIPSFSKINRYDLKSLNKNARLFCADILVSKIFRLIYLRGDYKALPEGNFAYKNRRPGTKTDTVIVIDEIQELLPGTGAESRDTDLLYNRVVSQSRNFGGIFVAMSQSPDNFPELFHTNIGTMIILNTAANDIQKVKQVTGIKDMNLFKHLEHRNKEGLFDVALMKNKVGEYVSVRLPWFEE